MRTRTQRTKIELALATALDIALKCARASFTTTTMPERRLGSNNNLRYGFNNVYRLVIRIYRYIYVHIHHRVNNSRSKAKARQTLLQNINNRCSATDNARVQPRVALFFLLECKLTLRRGVDYCLITEYRERDERKSSVRARAWINERTYARACVSHTRRACRVPRERNVREKRAGITKRAGPAQR